MSIKPHNAHLFKFIMSLIVSKFATDHNKLHLSITAMFNKTNSNTNSLCLSLQDGGLGD